MEPITTAVAAVAAASKAIEFIKARINDVQSVADISQQIGTLFDCQKKLNDERNKQEQKEAQAKARREAIRKAKEFEETLKTVLIIIGVIVVAVGLFVFLMISVARAMGVA